MSKEEIVEVLTDIQRKFLKHHEGLEECFISKVDVVVELQTYLVDYLVE